MNSDRHFIVYTRTVPHCANWLIRAQSLGEAMTKFANHDMGAKSHPDGTISIRDSDGSELVYEHPLQWIESEWKSRNGGEWQDWEIRELREGHWRAGFAEVFCSSNPQELKERIRQCRPKFDMRFPRSRASAFVWYLVGGPLVTFYKRKSAKRRTPIEVLARFYLPYAGDEDIVLDYTGTFDDILAQMAIEYPLLLEID